MIYKVSQFIKYTIINQNSSCAKMNFSKSYYLKLLFKLGHSFISKIYQKKKMPKIETFKTVVLRPKSHGDFMSK